MEISNKLKDRFCKDCKIPIKIFQEPYFTDRLELLDPFYDCINKWNLYLTELSKYDNEQDYYEDYNAVKDSAINFIKSTPAYIAFNEMDMNQFRINHTNLPATDIFKSYNDNKMFISIDMKKANFSTLRNFGDMFDNATTWEEFISKFTNNQHIINSKYIRQVILGNCNPKRHITYEKYLMDNLLTKILTIVDISNIVFFSNDEIVIDVENINDKNELKNKIINITSKENIPYRVELFKLIKIGNLGYAKIINDNKLIYSNYTFKCVDSTTIPFIIRHILKQDIQENDKVFITSDGYLAKLIDYPII